MINILIITILLIMLIWIIMYYINYIYFNNSDSNSECFKSDNSFVNNLSTDMHNIGNTEGSNTSNKIKSPTLNKISTNVAQQISDIESGNMDYINEIRADDNSDLTYYYNDSINQGKISEDAYDLVNGIDKIDYSNVKTGLDKCREKCNGVCWTLGWSGVATCYPYKNVNFDWGTIYKNPTFITSNNVFNDPLNQ